MTTTAAAARFTLDNTEGYSAADLAVLNARFAEVCAAEGIDLEDPDDSYGDANDFMQHLAGLVLAEFDSQQEG